MNYPATKPRQQNIVPQPNPASRILPRTLNPASRILSRRRTPPAEGCPANKPRKSRTATMNTPQAGQHAKGAHATPPRNTYSTEEATQKKKAQRGAWEIDWCGRKLCPGKLPKKKSPPKPTLVHTKHVHTYVRTQNTNKMPAHQRMNVVPPGEQKNSLGFD